MLIDGLVYSGGKDTTSISLSPSLSLQTRQQANAGHEWDGMNEPQAKEHLGAANRPAKA